MNVNDAPQLNGIYIRPSPLPEDSLAGTFVGNLSVSDEDADQTIACQPLNGSQYFTLSLLNETNGSASFMIVVSPLNRLDFELEDVIEIRIVCTDDGIPSLSVEGSVFVQVKDVNEAPYDILLSGSHQVPEHSQIGWPVGDLTCLDPDRQGQSFTYILLGPSASVFRVSNKQTSA